MVAEVGVYVDQIIVSNTFSGSGHNLMLLKKHEPFNSTIQCRFMLFVFFSFFNPLLMYIFCVSVPF